LCHGLNYVPIYQAIPCPQITNKIAVNIQATLLAISSEYKISISRLKSGSECRNFQKIDDWQKALHNSVDRAIFKRMFQGSIQDNRHQNSANNSTTRQLVNLIREAIDFNELEVWRFQISHGCDYVWAFDNESYAFKSKEKLFVIIFGWAN
jgi:tRNA U34 5-carboxymethylaminomethyl modifying enzyme MnmG/GidA